MMYEGEVKGINLRVRRVKGGKNEREDVEWRCG